MNMILSIVIPVYNGARWLDSALNSVFQQNIEIPYEVIIIDDGSTDGTAEIINNTKSRHIELKSLKNETNAGIVKSLNSGLDLAQGKFIARMDADDLCSPSRFIKQINYLQRSDIDLCGSWFEEFGNGIPRVTRWPHTEAALRVSLLFQNSICHPTIMARREVFEKFRYREEYRLAEDYDLFVRAMSEFRIANIPEVLLRYRRHSQQATQAQRAPMETITQKLRIEALAASGVMTTEEEQRIHNLIRAPHSINSLDDLTRIESWLIKLSRLHDSPEAKQVIASQWLRACVRAAPLGSRMLRAYRASAFRGNLRTEIDLSALAAMKLDYSSKGFAVLRRLGLSA